MMAFFWRCYKNVWFNLAIRSFTLLLFTFAATLALAQTPTEVSEFRVERLEDDVVLSAQVLFELPPAVEDALIKGVAMYFTAEADVLRERWYWSDKKVSSVQRQMRLAYLPLTRRWRLNVNSGVGRESNIGLALNQSFDTLTQALASVRRVSRWKIGEVGELDASQKYKVEFRFHLDLSQLPRPFQIGTFGQADWDIGATVGAPLTVDLQK
jgi:hypothetical protein